jgi:hypothetical protein
MLFSRINKTDPEKVFIVVKAGEALIQGKPVCYHFSGTDDGKLGYLANAAADHSTVCGIADAAIPSGSYGLVQCYGYRSDAYVILATSQNTNVGGQLDITSLSSGALYLLSSVGAAGDPFVPFVLAISASSTTCAETPMGVFIRCM